MASFPNLIGNIAVVWALLQTKLGVKGYIDRKCRDEQASLAHEDIKEEFTQADLLLSKNKETLTESKKVLKKGFGIVNHTCPQGFKAIPTNVVTAGNSSILDRGDIRKTWADSKKPKNNL